MATSLPSELDVGRRSDPNPAGPVSMEAPGTQGYDIRAQNTQKFANSMGMVADELYKAREDWATVNANDALNKLGEKLDLAKNNPENTGWGQQERQKAADPKFFDTTVEQFGGIHKSVEDTITDPLVKQKFQQRAQGMMMMQKAKVLEHQASERSKWDIDVMNTTVSRNLKTINTLDVASPTFASTYKTAVADAENAVGTYMQNRVKNDAEGLQYITEATQNVRDQFGTALLTKVIDENRPDIAKAMWEGTYRSDLPAFKEVLSAKERQQLAPRIEHAYVTFDVAQKVEGFLQPIVSTYQSSKASNAEVVLGNMPMPTRTSTKVTVDSIIGNVLKREGSAYVPDDNGQGPSRYGITGKNNPEAGDISKLTEEGAREVYKSKYWKQINGDALLQSNPAFAIAAMDTIVNFNPVLAKRMIDQANGDPAALLTAREAAYRSIASTERLAKYLPGWLNRNAQVADEVQSVGDIARSSQTNSLYSQTGQRRTLAAQSEALADTVEKFIIDNKIPPDKAELYRSKAMTRLSGLVAIESAQQNQAAGNLLTRILEKGYSSIDQVKADPEAVQWFKQIDPTQQWHMNSILTGNRNKGNEDTNFTTSPGYHDLFKDVMDGKVKDMTQLTSRLGYGQVGLHYFPFFNKLIEDRKTGHDIIYKELDQQTRTILSQWKANPMWSTPAMIEKMGFQLEKWQQGVQTKITEANALPQAQRDNAVRDMFDVKSPNYVGYGGPFERAYRPDAETIAQTATKYIESGNALPPGKEGVQFDADRKRAYLGANIQMLDRGKEKEQYNLLPKNTNFVVFNPVTKQWVAKTKVE